MRPKYAVIPGYVRSRTDGDTCFVGAAALIGLYGVKRYECVVIRVRDHHSQEMPDDAVRLRPRTDGNYSLDDAWKRHLLSRHGDGSPCAVAP